MTTKPKMQDESKSSICLNREARRARLVRYRKDTEDEALIVEEFAECCEQLEDECERLRAELKRRIAITRDAKACRDEAETNLKDSLPHTSADEGGLKKAVQSLGFYSLYVDETLHRDQIIVPDQATVSLVATLFGKARYVTERLTLSAENEETKPRQDWEKAFQAQVTVGAKLEKRIAELERENAELRAELARAKKSE